MQWLIRINEIIIQKDQRKNDYIADMMKQLFFLDGIDAIISWYKDGQPLYKSLGGKQSFDGHLSRLVLTSVADGHSGVYECAASNTGGEVRTCCRVSVMGKFS